MKEPKMSERLMKQRSTWGSGERIGLIGWLSLYLSGVLVVFLVLGHILFIHFISDADITAQSVYRDLQSGFISFLTIALLPLGVFHGLMGLRRVILDIEILGKKGDRVLLVVLGLVGVFIVIIGIEIFFKFKLLASP
jgi:succinate dehydrogenase / fumarate reductase membrane anchor subunit